MTPRSLRRCVKAALPPERRARTSTMFYKPSQDIEQHLADLQTITRVNYTTPIAPLRTTASVAGSKRRGRSLPEHVQH
eukprot:8906738-Pyramimonas_sp.AAC.1